MMNTAIINWPGMVIFLTVIFLFGTISTIWPIKIARIITLWPRFIYSKLFKSDDIPSSIREASNLIDDPEAYSQEFHQQLLMLRISGGIALLMFFCIVVVLVLSFT